MENNCLVTTLKAAINDNSLLRMGEMRIKISSIESPNEFSQSITFGFNKSVGLEIIGDGYFTDATLSTNNGKKLACNVGRNIIYFSNGNYEIAVLDKYSINYLMTSKKDGKFYPNKVIKLEDLKYSKNLVAIQAWNNNLSGDISALSNLTSLVTLAIPNNENVSGDISALSGLPLSYLRADTCNLSGDISSLSGLTSLTNLGIDNNNLSGDISSLSGLTSLTNLSIGNNNLSGDISSLSGLTSLIELYAFNNQNIIGDISSLSGLTSMRTFRLGTEFDFAGGTKLICSDISSFNSITSLISLYLKGVKLQGDLSLLPASLQFLTNGNNESRCSWNNIRPSSSNIFAIEGNLPVDNIDSMLNDFSNCVVPSNKPSYSYYSAISIVGTRTSASDAAVSSLKSKGYTIRVNGVTI